MNDARAVASWSRLLADESRASMCLAMLDGAAWTVTELARVAGVGLPTASEHISKLVAGGWVERERQGREHFVRLADRDVAHALETLAALAEPSAPSSLRAVNQRRRLATARTCYDHLAGRLGVAVFDALVERRVLDTTSGLAMTTSGETWFEDLGVDMDEVRARSRTRRPIRDCLDLTERRPHLAGAVGAAMCDQFLSRQWVRRTDRTRALQVTALGERALADLLELRPADLAVP